MTPSLYRMSWGTYEFKVFYENPLISKNFYSRYKINLPICYVIYEKGHCIDIEEHKTYGPTILIKYIKKDTTETLQWLSYVLTSSEYKSLSKGKFIIPSSEPWDLTGYDYSDYGTHLYDEDDEGKPIFKKINYNYKYNPHFKTIQLFTEKVALNKITKFLFHKTIQQFTEKVALNKITKFLFHPKRYLGQRCIKEWENIK